MRRRQATVGVRSCEACANRTGFCDLPDEVLREMDRDKLHIEKQHKSVLFAENEKCSDVYVVCTGSVRLSRGSDADRPALLKIAERGDLLGAGEAVTARDHMATAEAAAGARVARLPRMQFLKLMEKYPVVGLRTSQRLGADCLEAFAGLGLLRSPASTMSKLIDFLLRAASESAGSSIAFTHAELAELLGTSRETITRLLRQLQRQGAIITGRGTLSFPDLARLKRLATEM
jgi:CRP/FNR family cyclic AMP-dependent transcriptional regulator